MKASIVLTLLFSYLLIRCGQPQSIENNLLEKAESLIKVNPDSASHILNSIPSPENLNDKTFARWCMLSGKVTDKIFNTILPTYQFERAYEWYSSHGTPDEQVQILIYLGRSHFADGDYDRAMSIYTDALNIAEKNKLNNLTGYTYSYIGDLYREKFMFTEAIKRYKSAAKSFKKENNTDSYACALRDVGREYARMDSLSLALSILMTADSIAVNTKNTEVTASINNTLGNIYAMQNKYDEAEKYLLEALSTGKEKKNYKEALAYLEEYVEITDSIIYADSQSKTLDIETRYNHLKISKEVDQLKIRQQSYIILSIICIMAVLLIMIGYLLYRKKAKEKIQRQQAELNQKKKDLLYTSLELEEKRKLLDTLKEKDEKYNEMQEEIFLLTTNYKELQNKFLKKSPLFKELMHLANQNKPGNNKPIITDKQWKLIANEITDIYPNFRSYIYNLCPDLQTQEFMYCCFYMFGFDTNAEAKLLNIAVESVRKKRLRLRLRLGIELPNSNPTLREYILEKIY